MNGDLISQLHKSAQSALELGNIKKAKKKFEKIIEADPSNFQSLQALGILYGVEKNYINSIKFLEKASKIQPENEEVLYNLGKTYSLQKNYSKAIFFYEKSLKKNPNYFQALSNISNCLNAINNFGGAIKYATQALNLSPYSFYPYLNLGAAYRGLRSFDKSLEYFAKAIELNDQSFEIYLNLGDLFFDLKQYDKSILSYKRAIELKPDLSEGLLNIGRAFHELGQDCEAVNFLRQALKIDPELNFCESELLHILMKNCDWKSFKVHHNSISSRIKQSKAVYFPFAILTFINEPATQLQNAKNFSLNLDCTSKKKFEPYNSNTGKLKLGYFSADFHNHATTYLMAELFELHDKSKFELFCFSYGPQVNDEMQQRIKASFDHYFDLQKESDSEISALSRSLKINIAIDLKGYTKDARPGIFFNRAAPIQINYLGYPGTMGSSLYDYLIADKVLIPQEYRNHYTENIIYLPNSYQVNDRKRPSSVAKFNRSEMGLPEGAFVFCCFNNSFKITPEIFELWMTILNAVPNSVLWLYQYSENSINNLIIEANKLNVSSSRLIFAKPLPLADHLARYRCADLFLDTSPYNAHTTASDALWSGLPILTLTGVSFASRVSASLLSTFGLFELISNSPSDYITKAINLAKNKEDYQIIKSKLSAISNSPLFDTPSFAKNIESAFLAVQALYEKNNPNNDVYIQ
jgi:protein O-GlcNAc transferase